MSDYPWVQQKEHRVGSYNKGCRCSDCREAKRRACAGYRRQRRRARERMPGDVMCCLCGDWFRPRGIAAHESHCDG